jgi:hypothetical protein
MSKKDILNGASFRKTIHSLPPFISHRNKGQVAKSLSHEHHSAISSNDLILCQFSRSRLPGHRNAVKTLHPMIDIENEIKRVANFMKAPIPIGQPLHQIKKLIDVLEERRRTQLKFTPERMKHWQGNYDSLILAGNQILNETPKA